MVLEPATPHQSHPFTRCWCVHPPSRYTLRGLALSPLDGALWMVHGDAGLAHVRVDAACARLERRLGAKLDGLGETLARLEKKVEGARGSGSGGRC